METTQLSPLQIKQYSTLNKGDNPSDIPCN